MRSFLRFAALIVWLLAIASCGDDPISPGPSHTSSAYQADLLALNSNFRSTCGTGTGDVYAVGPVILHHDGTSWRTVMPPESDGSSFRSSFGFPDGSLLVSYGWRTFLGSDGAWTDISSENVYLDDVWGSSPDDIYAVDWRNVSHFDGSTWSPVTLPGGPTPVYAVAGRSSDDVVMCGDYGAIYRYDGTEWSTTRIDSTLSYDSAAITASGRLFVSTWSTVYEIVGSTRRMVLTGVINRIRLCADGDVLYLVGQLAYDYNYFVIARFENDEWHNVTLEKGFAYSLSASHGNLVLVGGDNLLWRGTNDGGLQEHPYPTRGNLVCAANIDGELFVAGEDAYRYEDGVWTDLDKAYVTRAMAWGLAGRNRNDIYAVGSEMILHYDGRRWTWMNGGLGYSLRSPCIDANGDLLAASGTPQMVRLHGSTMTAEQIPGESREVRALWSTGETVFAVGSSGLIAVKKNGVWRTMDSATNADLYNVFGFSENRVYAMSSNTSELRYYDGRSWQPMIISGLTLDSMQSLWGRSPADLFVADYRGAIVHFDGKDWTPLTRVLPSGLLAICGNSRETLVLGYDGVASYRRP